MPFPSYYLDIMNRQAVIMLRAINELGFSPAARVRVQGQNAPGYAPLIDDAENKIVPLAQYVANAPRRPRGDDD
jgi:hypothetical protein